MPHRAVDAAAMSSRAGQPGRPGDDPTDTPRQTKESGTSRRIALKSSSISTFSKLGGTTYSFRMPRKPSTSSSPVYTREILAWKQKS